jgi:hypothetical protein
MRSWDRAGKQVAAVNFTLEREALDILRRYSPSPRGYGRFLARLLYAEEARRQERSKIIQDFESVVGAHDAA